MKIRILLVVAIGLAFCSAALAQAQATGRVLAEVVESADVSFTGETEFYNFQKRKKSAFTWTTYTHLKARPALLLYDFRC